MSGNASASLTLETLLGHMISEYQQVATVPSGIVVGPVSTSNEGVESIRLDPKCHWESGYPHNLAEFLPSAAAYGLKDGSRAFPWYCRSRLRYSCSTLAANWVRFLVPELKKRRITELPSSTLGNKLICLSNLEIYTVLLVPRKRFALDLVYPFMGTINEIVEAYQPVDMAGMPNFCSHNVLQCRKSGVVVDLSMGQFTGDMSPHVFPNMKACCSHMPSDVKQVNKTSSESIDEQVQRDESSSRKSHHSVGSRPIKFARRVIQASQDSTKTYCHNCYGVASNSSTLKRCTRCWKTQYCGQACQVMHWKLHKADCVKAAKPKHRES